MLDEPNANLDDVGEEALTRAVQQLRAQGSTVVLISHRPNVIALADQLVIMQNGHIQVSGPRDAVLKALRPQPADPACTRQSGSGGLTNDFKDNNHESDE